MWYYIVLHSGTYLATPKNLESVAAVMNIPAINLQESWDILNFEESSLEFSYSAFGGRRF